MTFGMTGIKAKSIEVDEEERTFHRYRKKKVLIPVEVPHPPPHQECWRERALICAIIADAVSNPTETSSENLNHGQKATYKQSGSKWIISDSSEPFSFLWCCHVVGINPFLIRTKIKNTGVVIKSRGNFLSNLKDVVFVNEGLSPKFIRKEHMKTHEFERCAKMLGILGFIKQTTLP